ncbi:MAG: Glycosyl transferase family protein [Candidatus Uhrbacteria bacterium GW2011_GWF2_40_263]|nr:MAG: Glycosyl transferase family protein [Candidatus Uhrbacteria bacterium GW2011_GWF2_40_263]
MNMQPCISINIVTWNSLHVLPALLKTIKKQTFQEYRILIIDNGSTDGTITFLQEHYPEIMILRNAKNLGFTTAHNQGIRYAIEHWSQTALENCFILVTNPDTLWTPTFLEELMKEAELHLQAGSFGGKLFRAFSENGADEIFKETVHSDILDSTGLRAHHNRTFTDRGAGELDQGQYDDYQDVFGHSGALVFYRASALQDTRFEDEFFDQDFFAYKEDIDLAWRFQQKGWESRYVPKAVAYHYRGMFGAEKMNWLDRISNRQTKSMQRNYYSNRNQWNLLMKNERFFNFCLAAPFILFSEVLRFLYVLFFETKNLCAFGEALMRTPKMWRKRRVCLQHSPVRSKEMRIWFS